MEIRKLTETDYEEAVELYRRLDGMHAEARPDCIILRDDVYPREHFVHNLTYPGGLMLGAFEGGRMVGLADATLWDESGMVKGLKVVCLDNIYVLPEARRRGVAARLFREVESWSREQGAVRLELHTWDFNRDAIAMYEAMGMAPQKHVFEKKL